jgi:hypothetical protein
MKITLVKYKKDLSDNDLKQSKDLFSEHYGLWDEKGPRPGKRISLNTENFRKNFLFDDNCGCVLHYKDNDLVGQAFFRNFDFKSSIINGTCIWITQLVVHINERNRGISKELLSKIVTKDVVVAGMLTCNPYSIKSLEKVSGALCRRSLISEYVYEIQKVAKVPYFKADEIIVNESYCVCRDNFQVDHAEINKILLTLDRDLGQLDSGDEFIAIVFPNYQLIHEPSPPEPPPPVEPIPNNFLQEPQP